MLIYDFSIKDSSLNMKCKFFLFSAAFLFHTFFCSASIVNNGAQIVINNNTSVNSTGDFVNQTSGSDGLVILNGNLLVGGNWTNTAGNQVFSGVSTGTVTLNGGDQTLYGAATFPNLTKNITSAATLTFTSGAANRIIITGTTNLQGANGQLLSLRSSASGNQWQFDPQGTRTFNYLDVHDSNNVNAAIIDVSTQQVVNSGNNTNWQFGLVVTFVAGANGSLAGTLVQVVAYRGNCTPVTANADAGYHFSNWTGGRSSTANPFTVTSVTKSITITANFEINSYTVKFLKNGNGSITGTRTQTITHGGDCTPVTPTPYAHYHFTNWTGDYVGVDNPLTITNVTSDMNINANFGFDQYTVTFVAGANGTNAGTLVQTVDYGKDCTQVTANPDGGFSFIGWTGDYEGNNNPLTITKVTSDMTVNSNFQATGTIPKMVSGLRFNVDQSEITGLAQFTHRPKIYGCYYDPIRDPAESRDRTAYSRILSSPSRTNPLTDIDCLWARQVYLYNRTEFRQAYTAGTTCEDFLTANPITDQLFSLYIKTSENRILYQQYIRPFHLTPPTITAIRNQTDTADITQATLNEVFIIKGTFFSRNFNGVAPLAWIEYSDSRNRIQKLRLKILRPYKYNNAYNSRLKSCMQVDTGVSELTVQMPARWPSGWNHAVDHNIVIDNSLGLATTDFGTN